MSKNWDSTAGMDQHGADVGMCLAAAILIRDLDQPTLALEVLGAAGLDEAARIRELRLDDYDAKPLLRVLAGQRRRRRSATTSHPGGRANVTGIDLQPGWLGEELALERKPLEELEAENASLRARISELEREPTKAMVEAAHAVLADPPYLNGDPRNTRNALRAALTAAIDEVLK